MATIRARREVGLHSDADTLLFPVKPSIGKSRDVDDGMGIVWLSILPTLWVSTCHLHSITVVQEGFAMLTTSSTTDAAAMSDLGLRKKIESASLAKLSTAVP